MATGNNSLKGVEGREEEEEEKVERLPRDPALLALRTDGNSSYLARLTRTEASLRLVGNPEAESTERLPENVPAYSPPGRTPPPPAEEEQSDD